MLMHISFYHPLGDTMSGMTVLAPLLSLPFPLTHRSNIRIIRKGRVTIHGPYGQSNTAGQTRRGISATSAIPEHRPIYLSLPTKC